MYEFALPRDQTMAGISWMFIKSSNRRGFAPDTDSGKMLDELAVMVLRVARERTAGFGSTGGRARGGGGRGREIGAFTRVALRDDRTCRAEEDKPAPPRTRNHYQRYNSARIRT
jgi:hypothetical protein